MELLSIPVSTRYCCVLIDFAILMTVLLISFGSGFVARQNLRFRPSSSFEPVGNLCCLQRLWKVRLIGWVKREEFGLFKALSKFCLMFLV